MYFLVSSDPEDGNVCLLRLQLNPALGQCPSQAETAGGAGDLEEFGYTSSSAQSPRMILDFHSDSCISDLSGFGPGIYVPPSLPCLPLQMSPKQDLGGLGTSGFILVFLHFCS